MCRETRHGAAGAKEVTRPFRRVRPFERRTAFFRYRVRHIEYRERGCVKPTCGNRLGAASARGGWPVLVGSVRPGGCVDFRSGGSVLDK